MKHIILLLILICNSSFARSKSLEELHSDNHYSIKVKVKRYDLPITSKATFLIKEFQFPSAFGVKTNSSISPELILTDKMKEVKVKLHTAFSFISLSYKVENNPKSAFFSGTNIYRVENGDSLNCSIFVDSVTFKGRGAFNMNLQTRLFKITEKYNAYSTSDTTSASFINELKIRDKALIEQISILYQERANIKEEFYQFLVNQCVGVRNFRLLNYLNIALHRGMPSLALRAKEFYSPFFRDNQLKISDSAHHSNYLIDYLYYKEKFEFELLYSDQQFQNKNGSDKLFQIITRKYSGKIRERMYLIAFIDLPSTYSKVYEFVDSALLNTHSKNYRDALIGIKNSTERNMEAFDFSLPNITGHIQRLNDFKDKVIVLDFWFTGCIPCRRMAVQMGPVINYFHGKKVVFLTVNVDKDKATWIKSIQTGEYTHPDNINLNTGGEGYDHPILVHYNINSYPRLIVINKFGRMITANPPTPNNQENTIKLIHLIETAL